MTLSSAPWWCAPVLALGWMWTVPAQIFCAPTRAALMAAARFMPGVWGVLVSRLFPGTTRTPLCFQLSGGVPPRPQPPGRRARAPREVGEEDAGKRPGLAEPAAAEPRGGHADHERA